MAPAKNLLTFVTMLIAAWALSAPAAARGLHAASHVSAAVADGQHHHHDDDGSVSSPDSEQNGAPVSDGGAKGIGHSHAGGAMSDLGLSDDPSPAPASPPLPQRPAAANTPALASLGWPPQIRPPRTA